MNQPDEDGNGRFVVSGDVRLWTVVAGSGRRVLLVHGGPGLDHHFVAPLASSLSTSFETWAPDLPGHGRSLREDGRTPGLRQLEDRLASWIDHLPFRFDAVIGHSLGAWLVREMLRHQELAAASVILISPPGSGPGARSSAFRRAETVAPTTSGDPDFRREVRRHVEAECGGRLPPRALDLLDRARLTHVARYRALIKNFHKHVAVPPRPFTPPCPVLVIAGEEDRTTPVGQACVVADAIAGARLETLEGLGHYPFFQDPERVADTIRAFLDTVEP
jgi:pimeloyl-ACP methyl ester carboxylesterase